VPLCNYGCGQEAKYQFRNSKWCCSKSQNSCPEMRKRNRKTNLKNYNDSIKGKEIKEKIKQTSLKNFGADNPSKSEKIKRKLKRNISKLKEKYQTFFKEEEMRYNPVKPREKEIQVHCKYNGCKNSKERGGWFTPTGRELELRIYCIENIKGNDGGYFYCSQRCKDKCELYYSRGSDPFRDRDLPYTYHELQIFRQEVLKRQKKEDGYNFCEKCYSTENLHVHHEKSVKTHPHLALDPENGIVFCEKCHYKYGHKTGTKCSTSKLAKCLRMRDDMQLREGK
jgi:hypothetical protein